MLGGRDIEHRGAERWIEQGIAQPGDDEGNGNHNVAARKGEAEELRREEDEPHDDDWLAPDAVTEATEAELAEHEGDAEGAHHQPEHGGTPAEVIIGVEHHARLDKGVG